MTARIASTRFGSVHWFDEIDSTNRYLLDEAASGAGDGLVAVADRQTAGRGRLDRTWEAPPGSSLLTSVLLRPALETARRPLVLLGAALAAAEAVHATCALAVQLKWPNDLVVGERKLAGLLAESAADAVVVGFGCNLDWVHFPDHLAEGATAVNLEGAAPPARHDLLVAWLVQLDAVVGALERGESETVVARASRSMSTLGRPVRVELGDRSLVGRAEQLTELGQLVVREGDGTEHMVAAGDVVHLRDA